MELNKLPKTTIRSQKRVGRGFGSGKGGHTVGRGTKGQKSRGKVAMTFEGTKIKKSLIKRLPLLRGKGKFLPKNKPTIINIKYLNLIPTKEEVTLATLDKYGLIKLTNIGPEGVKILGDGELSVALTVKVPVSKGAKVKIEKAGGKVLFDDIKKDKSEILNPKSETNQKS